MSRRYGRNQRRQARDRIARLEHDLHVTGTQYQTVASRERSAAADFKRLARQLVDELPDNCAALPELREVMLSHLPPGYIDMHADRRHRTLYDAGWLKGALTDMDVSVAQDVVRCIVYRLSCNEDLLSNRLRFSIRTGLPDDAGAYYAIDEHQLNTLGFSERAVEEMALRIARDLASWYGARGRARRR